VTLSCAGTLPFIRADTVWRIAAQQINPAK
jgi:hypothetical protein